LSVFNSLGEELTLIHSAESLISLKRRNCSCSNVYCRFRLV